MSIDTAANVNEAAVLHFRGELDATRTDSVRRAFAKAGASARVIVDLMHVSFIDSAGLGALIGGLRAIRAAGGEAAICCRESRVRDVLHTTGVDRIVEVAGSVAAAAAALSTAVATEWRP
jgi:anti-sigma B factor antagonist